MDNMPLHDPFADLLSDYADGELTPRSRAEVEQHLVTCNSCRVALAEIRAVAARAASLPDMPPAGDLWPGIARRLEARGNVARFEPRARRRFSFTLPQLAAAGLALMVLSGSMVWLAKTGDSRADFPAISADVAPGRTGDVPATVPVSYSDAQYRGAVEDLERTLNENRSRLDPGTVRILEQNIQSIDAAIDQCRRALEADPANAFLNNHLAEAQQRKIALLRRATALTAGS